ncbi:hypothetical protein [Anaeromyxobacter sp. PSR-1]|uniref:hypothetical protein n=1 Tax=unclassified Anaeromyxobacter TaxID=2620896 RepID=UPI0009E5F50A|nr:hypothetical protein [Anaeromyxobacter sp. PSR-1]
MPPLSRFPGHHGLSEKRALALRAALGMEALERFTRRVPLRRMHECVFGVLPIESEPVDRGYRTPVTKDGPRLGRGCTATSAWPRLPKRDSRRRENPSCHAVRCNPSSCGRELLDESQSLGGASGGAGATRR